MKSIFDRTFFTGINYWDSAHATKMWREFDEEVIKEIVNCGMEAIPGAMPLPKLQIPTNGTHL